MNRFFSSEWKIFCRALSENMLQPVERHHQGWAFPHTFCKRIVSCCFLCRSYPVLSCHWQKNWLGGTYSEFRLVDSVRWLGLSASCGQHKRNISSLNSFHELHRKRPIWRTWLFLPCQWTNRLPNHKSETICLLIWFDLTANQVYSLTLCQNTVGTILYSYSWTQYNVKFTYNFFLNSI